MNYKEQSVASNRNSICSIKYDLSYISKNYFNLSNIENSKIL